MDPVSIVYLLIAILSFLGSKKAGLSNGKAALVAAGVTGAAMHYEVGDKVVDWVGGLTGDGSDPSLPLDETPKTGASSGWLSSILGSTAGKVGAGALAGATLSGGLSSLFPWLLGGAALLIITR